MSFRLRATTSTIGEMRRFFHSATQELQSPEEGGPSSRYASGDQYTMLLKEKSEQPTPLAKAMEH